MSERLPYEEQLPQHLRDFRLPDEDAAWADMKRRLDDDDNDRPIVWWRRGCALWIGLGLLVALLITGWWYFNREKNDRTANNYTANDPSVKKGSGVTDKDTLTNISSDHQAATLPVAPHDPLPQQSPEPSSDTITSARKRNASLRRNQQQETTQYNTVKQENTSSEKQIRSRKNETTQAIKKSPASRKPSEKTDTSDTGIAEKTDLPVSSTKNFPVDSIKHFVAGDSLVRRKETVLISPDKWPVDSIKAFVTKDSVTQLNGDSNTTIRHNWPIDSIKAFVTGDSIRHQIKDSTTQQTDSLPPKDTSINKTDTTEKEFFLSAGLALTQQIPIAGQKAVPYSSQGRNFSLTDYIPSVYFRLNKKHRWFLQGEFRYGAPQYTKPVTYSIIEDTTGSSFLRTEKSVQKTYYHQLPLSFNYYITRDWALGAGLVWNRFTKSIFEESQFSLNPLNPFDTIFSKETMIAKDPASQGLSKSYFQGLIESQYQWKKFSFGARYTFGLSPYLKFTLPGEAERKERNQSLQFFIRYNLWTKSLKE